MKKIQLGLVALGLTGILASCGGGDVVISSGYYGSYNSSSSATLNSLTNYTTDYTYNGQSVICYDRTTTLNFDLSWSGYLSEIGFQLKGYNTGNYENTDSTEVNSYGGTAPVSITVASGMAPLSITNEPIKAQSIVVNPTSLGYTYVRAQGIDGDNHYTNIVQTDYSIPVMDCNL